MSDIQSQFVITVLSGGKPHFWVNFQADIQSMELVTGIRELLDRIYPDADDSEHETEAKAAL